MYMEVIFWIGLSQSLFAALIIATKRNMSTSDLILFAWLFLLATSFLIQGVNLKVFGYPLLPTSFLLFNPALFFYINTLVKNKFKLKWIHLLHLLPYIVFETTVYALKIPLSVEAILNKSDSYVFSILFISIMFLSWFYYIISSSILVHQYRKNLQNQFSTIGDNNSLIWIIFLLWFYVTFCVTIISFGSYSYFTGTEMMISYNINYTVLLLLVYILGFYGLRQKRLYVGVEDEKTKKYQKSFLSETRKQEIKNQIIQYFENEKPYLNSEFCMDHLSSKLSIPKHHLTEVLNIEIKKNFFLFVNTYRIENAKKILHKKSKLFSIEAIGYDCGFSSKSSFYTTFKKITGKTPLQYMKSIES